ncbi:hypothetical protein FQR65_LT07614 [Abscondita terminalis]|nr:hypothetical protein FQR65_LT07614 [Abscondita terminalis]
MGMVRVSSWMDANIGLGREVDVSLNRTVTCGYLLERSIKLSVALKEIGIANDHVVGLICENTIESFTPFLALTFLGIPINLINASYTVGELKHIFNISKAKCVICSQISLDSVLKIQNDCFINTVISIDKLENNLKNISDVENLIAHVENYAKDFDPVETNHDDTVIICMSSGTTGLPKCVELTNANVFYVIGYILDKQYINATPKDVTVSVVPMAHIYGVIIYLSAVVSSMKLVTMKNFKPMLYLSSIEKYKATKLFAVPQIVNFLATNEMVQDFDLSSVNDILTGGSSMEQSLYQKAREKFNRATIRELYGLTEGSGVCSIQQVSDRIRSSGTVVRNISFKVIDQNTMKSLSVNEIGEICFKGVNCMKGYLNNPVETKNAFDADGFYRTGDLGYYDENNRIYIYGRSKEIIKYKAFQVPPVEVENVLLQHSAVKECGVFGRPDDKVGELTTAVVVLHDDNCVTENEILQFVAEKLSTPKHLHGGLLFVEKIPKNDLGKILRKELPEMFNSTKKEKTSM